MDFKVNPLNICILIYPNIIINNHQDANPKFLLAAWPNVAHLYSSLPLSATQLDAALHLTSYTAISGEQPQWLRNLSTANVYQN